MPAFSVRPRDYLVTLDGSGYAVVDARLERGTVLAALRYVPRAGGWHKLAPADGLAWLRQRQPGRLLRVARFDADMPAVPVDDIARVLRATEHARALLEAPPAADPLAAAARHALVLLGALGLEPARLGITGSLLLGSTRRGSDIDLVVYGRAAFAQARAAVAALLAAGDLQPLTPEDWARTFARRPCGLTLEEFVRHETRKRTRVLLRGIKLDLVCVPDPDEIADDEGPWEKRGMLAVRARVCSARQAWDYPARYAVADGPVDEILAWSHAYTGQADEGDCVEAVGWLEVGRQGQRRLVVGSALPAPGELLRVVPH